jgi:hypothetical protein
MAGRVVGPVEVAAVVAQEAQVATAAADQEGLPVEAVTAVADLTVAETIAGEIAAEGTATNVEAAVTIAPIKTVRPSLKPIVVPWTSSAGADRSPNLIARLTRSANA